MQDKNDDVSILQIPRKWFTVCSWVFIGVILGFTVFAPFSQRAQDLLDNKWLHRGSILMTLIIGYIFIVARLLYDFTSRDSENSYKKGQEAVRDDLRDWVDNRPGTSLQKQEVLDKLKDVGDDP